MIFMININLLPPEHQKVDKTPLGLFLLIFVGLVFFGLTVTGYFILQKQIRKKNNSILEIQGFIKDHERELASIGDLEEKIQKALIRQKTIIDISMSKIRWSQKLVEFAKILKEHPIWVDSIRMNESTKTLVFNCYSKGLEEIKVANFRKAILQSQSFYSIFKKIKPYRGLRVVNLEKLKVKDPRERLNLEFTLELELKTQVETEPNG